MSYRNPQIIIDRSGEIWGKAIAGFGANVAKGIDTFAAAHEKAQAAANRRKESNQLALNVSELKENEKINKFVKSLPDKSMNDQVGQTIREMATTGLKNTVNVNGKDYTLGAIKAQALLKSDPNLDKDTREAYLKIVSGYNQYMDNMGGVASSITVNNSELRPEEPGFISQNYDILGEGGEGTANLIAAMSVNSQPIKGVESKKEYGRGYNKDTGKYDNTLTINSRIDKNSIIYKSWLKNGLTTNGSEEKGNLTQQFEEELDSKGNPTGYVTSKFERNLNEIGEEGLGLIVKIPEQGDINKALNDAGYRDPKTGTETGLGFVTEKIVRNEVLDNGDTVTATETHFDAEALENNTAYKVINKATFDKIDSLPLDQQIKYMSNNLGWGGIEKTPWAEMNTEEKEILVMKTLMDRDLRNIMGVSKKNLLKTRKATPEDVAKYKADNKTIKVDDDIYFTEKLQTVKRAGGAGGSAGSVTQQIALKKYNDSLKNKSDAVKTAADKGSSLLSDTNSTLVNEDIPGYGKVESAELNNGVLEFIYARKTGKRDEDGSLVVDRSDAKYDLKDGRQLNTLANQLYKGDKNADKRKAFIKSIQLQIGVEQTAIGKQSEQEKTYPTWDPSTGGFK
tara:strand:+ start:1313 stop:3181 length:1869 start_codon:yes stop_codon:yes gene_type:complete